MSKMDFVVKLLNVLLFVCVAVLVLISILALVAIHCDLIKNYSFSFSPTGINTYLSALGEFKALFTATVATIAVYFGLHRLKAATDANEQKLKQDRFIEWKTILDLRLLEIEQENPYMKTTFIKSRLNLFDALYVAKFSILTKENIMPPGLRTEVRQS